MKNDEGKIVSDGEVAFPSVLWNGRGTPIRVSADNLTLKKEKGQEES
jgi:hypothetical protein